jgi:NitT/TauT family transport system substrate-binding protein
MKRKMVVRRQLAVFGMVSLLTGGILLPSSAPAAEDAILKFDWVPYGKYVGYYAAREKGMYKNAGINMSFQRGYGGPSSSVAAGKQDYGLDAVGSVVVARSKGMKVKMISMWHERLMYNVLALKSSGIRTLKDLEGKNIATTFGDALHRNWPLLQKAVGLKNLKWTYIRPAAKNPSLIAKKVDAIITYTTVAIPVRLQAKKINEEVVEFLWSDYGVKLPTDGLMTTDAKIRENPNQVRGFVKASLEGNAWAIENPEEAVKIFLKFHPDQNPKLTKLWWNLSSRFQVWGNLKTKGLGYMDPGIMQYTRDAIAKAYEMKNPPAMNEWYTTKFLPKSLPKPKLPSS